jgi:hypothetical protein
MRSNATLAAPNASDTAEVSNNMVTNPMLRSTEGDAMTGADQFKDRSVRMEALCLSIPCLSRLSETLPWNPLLLAQRWHTASGGEQAAIQFVISVWNNSADHTESWRQKWGFFPFTLSDFAQLDNKNQAAVAAWFAAPFWP